MTNKVGKHHLYYPEDIIVIGKDTNDGPEHPMYSDRVNESLDSDMVDNIRYRGVIQPIVIIEENGASPVVVAGRRRVVHAREANKLRIKDGEPPIRIQCIVKNNPNPREMLFVKASENNFRRATSPMEKAAEAARMLDEGMSNAEVQVAMGWNTNTLYYYLRFLKAPKELQDALDKNQITVRAALSLVTIKDESEMLSKLAKIRSSESEPIRGLGTALENEIKGKAKECTQMYPRRTLLKRISKSHLYENMSTDAQAMLQWVLGVGSPKDVPGLSAVLREIKDNQHRPKDQ